MRSSEAEKKSRFAGGSACATSTQNDQAQPQPQKRIERDRQRADSKELRRPVLARIMVHSDLRHVAAAEFQFAHQFDANRAAGGGQVDLFEQIAADQPVIAIDVADADAEQQARAKIVNISDPDAMGRVVPIELVAVHQPRVGTHEFQQSRKFADIVLPVAIGVEHEFFARCGEPAAQRASVAAVLWVSDDPQKRAMLLHKLLQHLGRLVPAAVIYHDDFIVRDVFFKHGEGVAEQWRERRRVVIRRKEDAQRRKLRISPHPHNIFSPMKMSDWPAGRSWPAPIQAASIARGRYNRRSIQGASGSTPLAAGWRSSGSQRRNFASATGSSSELA